MKNHTKIHYGLFSLIAANVACSPSRSSECLSASSSDMPLAPTSHFVQGGYIHFGDKTCTASFEVRELGADEILLKGFSARHCRFENEGDHKKISISLYFDKTAKRSAGYVRAIPVTESFAERASKALRESSALNVGNATALVADALKIPVQYDPWTPKKEIFSSSGSIICNNFQIIPKLPENSKALSHSCWSFLDLGIFELRLTKSTAGENTFRFISEQLKDKKRMLNEFLQANSDIAAYTELHRTDANAVIGLLRLQKYARLAYILNHDLCRVSSSATVDTGALCAVQKKLIEIVGQHLVEFDETGRSINIFDKIATTSKAESSENIGLPYAELVAGRRLSLTGTPINFDQLDKLAATHAETMNGVYRATNVVAIMTMRDEMKKFSGTADETQISPSLLVGTNFTAGIGNSAKQLQYGQFSLSSLSSRPEAIHVNPQRRVQYDLEQVKFGVTMHGTLRIGVEKQSEVVSFFPTDSGSMLFLKGVIPLMVLNTVNDNATSGGASILALPEAKEESGASGGGKEQAGDPKNKSNSDAQVKISKNISATGGCL
ncbi:MAG: hypothetical protein RLZZ488_2373 [Pseudomonadota bacterium]